MQENQLLVSVVVIGRNEGARLIRCLNSVKSMHKNGFEIELVYVDSASCDQSVMHAVELGAQVIEIKPERPSAAYGRNAGWRKANGDYVLFLDGDTILHPQFVSRALAKIQNPSIAAVWGHRRELDPEQSIYVRVLDLDWVYPAGDSEFCGGDVLMRKETLEATNGFDDSLIAGEEPELCRRIRAQGMLICHIDAPMTLHDLAIGSFDAYCKRAFRAGYAYAMLASRFAKTSDPLWKKETRRNLFHGSAMLAYPLILIATLIFPWVSLSIVLLSFIVLLRTAMRCQWKTPSFRTRLLYALHSHFQQIPILFGQLAKYWDDRFQHQRGLIEYKSINN